VAGLVLITLATRHGSRIIRPCGVPPVDAAHDLAARWTRTPGATARARVDAFLAALPVDVYEPLATHYGRVELRRDATSGARRVTSGEPTVPRGARGTHLGLVCMVGVHACDRDEQYTRACALHPEALSRAEMVATLRRAASRVRTAWRRSPERPYPTVEDLVAALGQEGFAPDPDPDAGAAVDLPMDRPPVVRV
jgi:hypothetical protein